MLLNTLGMSVHQSQLLQGKFETVEVVKAFEGSSDGVHDFEGMTLELFALVHVGLIFKRE